MMYHALNFQWEKKTPNFLVSVYDVILSGYSDFGSREETPDIPYLPYSSIVLRIYWNSTKYLILPSNYTKL